MDTADNHHNPKYSGANLSRGPASNSSPNRSSSLLPDFLDPVVLLHNFTSNNYSNPTQPESSSHSTAQLEQNQIDNNDPEYEPYSDASEDEDLTEADEDIIEDEDEGDLDFFKEEEQEEMNNGKRRLTQKKRKWGSVKRGGRIKCMMCSNEGGDQFISNLRESLDKLKTKGRDSSKKIRSDKKETQTTEDPYCIKNADQKKLLISTLWSIDGDLTSLCSTCIKTNFQISNSVYSSLRFCVMKRRKDLLLENAKHGNSV